MIQFFIVGAQRSSTTWLYKMLQEHPEIAMAQPIRPEPKFFFGDDFINNKTMYQAKYFNNIDTNVVACGEKSTTYIESELAAKRIATMFPNSKIIILLRNPIKRAISNYYFSFNNGIENRTLTDAVLNKKPPPEIGLKLSTDPFNYLGRGVYQNHIEIYRKYFPDNNILILNNEVITKDISCLACTYAFLNVDKGFIPDGFDDLENSSFSSEKAPEELTSYLQKYFSKTFDYLSENFGISFEGEDVSKCE